MTNLSKLIKYSFNNKISDLHFVENEVPCLRQFGKLYFVDSPPVDHHYFETNFFPLVTEEKVAQFKEEMELDFSCTFNNLCRARVNMYYERGRIGAAVRLIPLKIPTMEELSLPESIQEFLDLKNGLVIVTGPTGSGKSTTLASMIEEINQNKRHHILTVEDPIEYLYQRKKSFISQREVSIDTHCFQNAIKHAFRQDPDVVLVGEMRNLDTIQTVITLAETGHLTFSTLHTNDAVETINRIIDSFPPYQQNQIRLQLMSCLRGVISQRLLPRKDGKGLIAVREIMVVNKAIRNLIKEGKTYHIHSTIQTGSAEGMCTLFQAISKAYENDQISYEVALENVPDRQQFLDKYRDS